MSPVTVEVQHDVAHVVLNRPNASNAIDLALAQGLLDAARTCRDGGVRAVLLAGAGRNFCVGGDLRGFGEIPADELSGHLAAVAGTLHDALRVFAALDAPIVAAVQGAVAGAGVALVAAADLALAAEDASFTLAYTAIGYTPDAGTTWTLPRLIGTRRTLELLLTNRRLSAAEAADMGLVNEVVPGDLDERAHELTERLARGATHAFGVTKRLIATGMTAGLDAQLDRETRAIAAAATSAEGIEGVAAFREKRPPEFPAPGGHHG
jgi:2-(1,2-epoxy-1,2-dihydrophenyl)acetyl-CoA isomerase